MDIKSLKNYSNNPRILSEKQHELLKRDLLELGDLSGIIHDLNSGEIVGGNQRVNIFKEFPDPKITISERFDSPTGTGTVAHGYVELNGEKYSYREVRWTTEQCQKANIVANKAGATWDFDVLAKAFEKANLLDWGFEDKEFKVSNDESKEKKEKKQHFSFNWCNQVLKTGGVQYFSLFRNADMDLEELKSDVQNICVFIHPVLNYLKEKSIKTVILPPVGDRGKKNGFHFATEIIKAVSVYHKMKMMTPFTNEKHIGLNGKIDVPDNSVIFDDIVTRGTTLKKMNELLRFKKNLVLISNH